MLNLDEVNAVHTIICHGPTCPDGIASAVLLHDALPEARIAFHTYGTEALAALEPKSGMLFCDFTPPRDRAKAFVEAGAFVLDHHTEAKDIVEMFGERGVYAPETERGVSGAVLAFREVWEPLFATRVGELGKDDFGVVGDSLVQERACARLFARIAGIRDTWQRHDALWEAACAQAAALMFFPPAALLRIPAPFRQGSELGQWVGTFGPLIHARHLEEVARAISEAHTFKTPGGLRCVAFNGYRYASDAADLIGKSADVVLGFKLVVDDKKQKMLCTLRSHTGVDVGAMAKRCGGGGHRASAGFITNPLAFTASPFDELAKVLAHAEQKVTLQ